MTVENSASRSSRRAKPDAKVSALISSDRPKRGGSSTQTPPQSTDKRSRSREPKPEVQLSVTPKSALPTERQGAGERQRDEIKYILDIISRFGSSQSEDRSNLLKTIQELDQVKLSQLCDQLSSSTRYTSFMSELLQAWVGGSKGSVRTEFYMLNFP